MKVGEGRRGEERGPREKGRGEKWVARNGVTRETKISEKRENI